MAAGGKEFRSLGPRVCLYVIGLPKLYFQKWESELRIEWQHGDKERYFKKGFVQGYRRRFGKLLKVTWEDCPVDFDVLEQVTLVRNKEQHPDRITTMRVKHDYDTKCPNLNRVG